MGEKKKALEASVTSLETLANGVKTGTIKDKAQLETAFAAARAAETTAAIKK